MTNLRKLIASVDSLNESTATPVAKPLVEGSMLKELGMITDSVAPKVALAREYKTFVSDSIDEAFEYPTSQIADPEERARIHELRALMGAFGNSNGLRRARHLYNKGMLKATPKETALLLKLTDADGTILPRTSPDLEEGFSDVVKGVKRKIAGKEDPKEVQDQHGFRARQAIDASRKFNNQAAYDDEKKMVDRYHKVHKVVNKEGVAEGPGVATEAEGTPEGLPHLTKTMLRNIVQQIGTEGAQAIVKSLEWGDGAAEELLQLIKQDLENHVDITESVKQRLDKSCWAGYRKAGTKIKGGVKVNNCVKESYGVFARTDESAPIKTFALKEDAVALARRYNKLNPTEGIKYVVRNVSEAIVVMPAPPHIRNPKKPALAEPKGMTAYKQGAQDAYNNKEYSNPYPFDASQGIDVNYDHNSYKAGYKVGQAHDKKMDEAMPPAVATASSKMNPGATKAAPTAATTAPGAPKAPGVAGTAAKVDPATAAAQKLTVQQNLKTVAPAAGPAQSAEMSMPSADQAKLAGAMSPLLQDPAAAKELAALTNKYKTKPGIQ